MRPAGVVLWDFDGTLAWREGRWSGCLVEALDEVLPGHAVTREAVAAGLQSGFPWHRPDEPHLHLRTGEQWSRALRPVLRDAYAEAGVDPGTAENAVHRVRQVYTDARCWRLFPDTVRVLERLRSNGWRHVVVSNHVPELSLLVSDLGLGNLVTSVLTSAATGYEKPHPRMFELARETAGRPDRIWMVGDSLVADVRGAEAVGIPALLVRAPGRGEGAAGLTLDDVADRILAVG